jgi:hypothetical protein
MMNEEEAVGLLQSNKQWQTEPEQLEQAPEQPLELPSEVVLEAADGVDKWRVDGTIPKALFAINNAEMGGVDNLPISHMVRTSHAPKGGSTAYGPYQMTTSLVKLYRNNKRDLFNADEIDYINRFIDQGNKFNLYGNNPHYDVDTTELEGYDSKYDYGGRGDLTDPEDMRLYQSVASKIFEDHLASTGGNVEEAIAKWRDSDRATYFEKDVRYKSVVEEALANPEGFEDWKKYVFEGQEYTPITPQGPDRSLMDHGVRFDETEAWGRVNEMDKAVGFARINAEMDNWDSVISDTEVVDTLKQWWEGPEEPNTQYDAISGSYGKDGGVMNIDTAMGRNSVAPVKNIAATVADKLYDWIHEDEKSKNGVAVRDFMVGDIQRALDKAAIGSLVEGTEVAPEVVDLALSMPFGLAATGNKILLRGRRAGTLGKALDNPRELGSHHTDSDTPGVAAYFAEHHEDMGEISIRRFLGDHPLTLEDAPSGFWNPEHVTNQLVKHFPESEKLLRKYLDVTVKKPMEALTNKYMNNEIDTFNYSTKREKIQSDFHKKIQAFIRDSRSDNVQYPNQVEGGISHIIFSEDDFEDITTLKRISPYVYEDHEGRMFKFQGSQIIDIESGDVLDLDKYAEDIVPSKQRSDKVVKADAGESEVTKLEDGVYQDKDGNLFTVKDGSVTSL